MKENIFSTLTLVIITITITIAVIFGNKDKFHTVKQNQEEDNIILSTINKSSTKEKETIKSQHLKNAIHVLNVVKNDQLEDANEYYMYMYMFAVVLGVTGILITGLILIVVSDRGWRESSTDIKASIGIALFVCSVCYFMPKLMNNNDNYKKSLTSYYSYKSQLIKSTSVLTNYYCCYANDTLLCATTDSCYAVIAKNLNLYFDINMAASEQYYNQLNELLKASKTSFR